MTTRYVHRPKKLRPTRDEDLTWDQRISRWQLGRVGWNPDRQAAHEIGQLWLRQGMPDDELAEMIRSRFDLGFHEAGEIATREIQAHRNQRRRRTYRVVEAPVSAGQALLLVAMVLLAILIIVTIVVTTMG